MGYEILSDDLLDNNPAPQKPPGKIKRFLQKINPFHIHLSLIVILLIGIIFIFFPKFSFTNFDFGFDFDFGNNETGILTLSGDFDDFQKNYQGNLTIYSSKFSIETKTAKFAGESATIQLENFTGSINQTNNSLIFSGKANTIKFGTNEISSFDGGLKITSSGKTQTDLFLENIYFKQLQGNVKLDSTLNYGFHNSSINLTNFQTKMTYDGSYTFLGKADKFEILSTENNIKIQFDKNLTKK